MQTITLTTPFGSADGCRVPEIFWALTTGEYQINIRLNAKGNMVVRHPAHKHKVHLPGR